MKVAEKTWKKLAVYCRKFVTCSNIRENYKLIEILIIILAKLFDIYGYDYSIFFQITFRSHKYKRALGNVAECIPTLDSIFQSPSGLEGTSLEECKPHIYGKLGIQRNVSESQLSPEEFQKDIAPRLGLDLSNIESRTKNEEDKKMASLYVDYTNNTGFIKPKDNINVEMAISNLNHVKEILGSLKSFQNIARGFWELNTEGNAESFKAVLKLIGIEQIIGDFMNDCENQ